MGRNFADFAGASQGIGSPRGCPAEASLFPGERPAPPTFPSVTRKLSELIGDRFKEVATTLWPKLSVKSAESRLSHAIAGEQGKRIGADQVDRILWVLGREKEAEFYRWHHLARGWKPPERMETLQWALRSLDEIRVEAQTAAAVLEHVARLEGVIRAALEER